MPASPLTIDGSVLVFTRFAITAFFAVVFLQSAVDKLTDPEGNLGFLREHFAKSPIPAGMVGPMYWTLTMLELGAGAFSALGIVFGGFADASGFAWRGLQLGTLALLALLIGQRLAKDYAGAAVIAGYFVVAVLGLFAFAVVPR